MRGQALRADGAVVAVDALGEILGRGYGGEIEFERFERAVPAQAVALDVPYIGHVARGRKRRQDLAGFVRFLRSCPSWNPR